MFKKLNDISIKWQLIVLCLVLISIPIVALGTISYQSAREEILVSVEANLNSQSLAWEKIIDEHILQVVDIDEREDRMIRDQINFISLSALKSFSHNSMSVDDIFNHISDLQVGKSGYVFILNSKGDYVVSKDRLRDGENIWNAKDSDGIYFIQKMITEGKKLKSDETYIIEYPWKNAGETGARMKIASITYYEPLDLIIGASAYYSDFKIDDVLQTMQEEVKEDISKQIIGKTGYIFVLDSQGNYVVSKDRVRDGENIWAAKDADGVLFIQEMIKNSKDLKEGETYVHFYPWKNVGESVSRMKIASLVYIPEWDWYVGASAYHADFLDGVEKIKYSTIIISLLALLLTSVAVFYFARKMTETFQKIVNNMNSVAKGNLNIEASTVQGTNEIGQMASSFSTMLTNLRTLVTKITDVANTSAATAEQLSASSQEVNASSEQVSTTVQEIARGSQALSKSAAESQHDSEELMSKIEIVTKSVSDATTKANEVANIAQLGAKSAQKAGNSMVLIKESVSASAGMVNELGEKTGQINKIIEVINSISEQTNLLALNAAIEAARAGEAGKGFAVVADEVRKLAEESQKATKQIEGMISEIMSSSNKVVESMSKGTQEVDQSSAIVNDALGSLEQITASVKSLAIDIDSASKVANEQIESSKNVQKSISEVSAVAEESAAGAEEVSASVEETTSSIQQIANSAQSLAQSASELKHLIDAFKL